MIEKIRLFLTLTFVFLVWLVCLVTFALYWAIVFCYVLFDEAVTRIRECLRM